MAKKSSIARNQKRIDLSKKYLNKRLQLKEEIRQVFIKKETPWVLLLDLQKFPLNSNPIRVQKRCMSCGRPRAVYKRFGLCRLCLFKYAMSGLIPGVRKASW